MVPVVQLPSLPISLSLALPHLPLLHITIHSHYSTPTHHYSTLPSTTNYSTMHTTTTSFLYYSTPSFLLLFISTILFISFSHTVSVTTRHFCIPFCFNFVPRNLCLSSIFSPFALPYPLDSFSFHLSPSLCLSVLLMGLACALFSLWRLGLVCLVVVVVILLTTAVEKKTVKYLYM